MIMDASVAAKLYPQEAGADEALALAMRGDLCAPDILLAETLNEIWAAQPRGLATADRRLVTKAVGLQFARLGKPLIST